MNAILKGVLLRMAWMTIFPVVIVTIYMMVTRNVNGFDTAIGDYTAIIASVLLGVIVICSMPVIWRYRILSVLLYLPIAFYGLAMYMFFLHVGITGDGP